MNSLKTLFVVAVLAGVAYAVYVTVNKGGALEDEGPAAQQQGFSGGPAVQMPGRPASMLPGQLPPGPTTSLGGAPGGFGPKVGNAPTGGYVAPSGGVAPPYAGATPYPSSAAPGEVSAPAADTQPPVYTQAAPAGPYGGLPSAEAGATASPGSLAGPNGSAPAPNSAEQGGASGAAQVPSPSAHRFVGNLSGSPEGSSSSDSPSARYAQQSSFGGGAQQESGANDTARADPPQFAGGYRGARYQGEAASPENSPLAPEASPAYAPPESNQVAEQSPGQGPTSAQQFGQLMRTVETHLEQGNLVAAHRKLSSMYDKPHLPVDQAQRVTELLDQLAGTVIYSRKHLLEEPYVVQQGESLEQIAEAYEVPWQLLARINGIEDPRHLEPGQQLKMVRGPFNAVVHLDRYELTLMVGGMYAGRFPIGIGTDRPNLEGSYVVCNKTVGPRYTGPHGTVIDAEDPNNPYGALWIGLGEQPGQYSSIGLHGTNDPGNLHRTTGRGSICLGQRDIDDLFGILTLGSKVLVRR